MKTDTSPRRSLSEAGLRRALGRRGRRYTRQRAAVYCCLTRQDSHPTAEALYLEVLKEVPHLSLATVYKSLEALVAAGVVTKLDFADSAARYDARCDKHVHARCLRCGRVLDVPGELPPAPPVDRVAMRGFQVSGYRIEVLGTCGECARRREKTKKPLV
ncbi:MAG: transcriptional repressor [Candidatus Tectomicrobia bacterium]|nr:transcriptional repressor [Candidatus Tectomicrobia bacterium]